MNFRIRNLTTGETIALTRGADARHPAWVHAQLETESEAELQGVLSNLDPLDYIVAGEDCCGVSVEG